MEAFEHYNSGRDHVFPLASFGGSLHRLNTVHLVRSRKGAYPSGHNMSYLNANAAFIQGGSYGDVKGSIGPFVAKVDPKTLKPVWYTQLRNTVNAGEWDYPGAMAIERDGYIYVVSGYRIFKVDPASGKVVKTLELPTMVHNPKTMQIIDNIALNAFAGARPTITRYNGVDYVYLLEKISNAVRYSVHNGVFKLDTSWTPAAVPSPNQTAGGSLIVFNNWIVGATNSIPAAGRLTVFAINQGDAKKVLYMQPYVNDKIPPELDHAFAKAAGGKQAVSWADMSLEADPQTASSTGWRRWPARSQHSSSRPQASRLCGRRPRPPPSGPRWSARRLTASGLAPTSPAPKSLARARPTGSSSATPPRAESSHGRQGSLI